jgi:hypothetical protein
MGRLALEPVQNLHFNVFSVENPLESNPKDIGRRVLGARGFSRVPCAGSAKRNF